MNSRWREPPSRSADELKAHLAQLDAETLRRDTEERAQRAAEKEENERQLREAEIIAKDSLAKAIQRRNFGDAVIVIGVVFLLLVAVLPPNPHKDVLYLGAAFVIFCGAAQRDWAHRRIAKLLPELSSDVLKEIVPRK